MERPVKPLKAAFCVALLALAGLASAAIRDPSVGLKLEAYPAGMQALLSVGRRPADHWLCHFDAGWNEARRWDWGLHADERGGGPGFGWGLRWSPAGLPRLFVGGEVQLWFLSIEWRQAATRGTTRSTVLQPAAELGWTWDLGEAWRLEPLLSLGQEINVWTEGEAVGQGPILRLGIGVRRQF